MFPIDPSLIIFPKSFNPICNTRIGWVALVTYQDNSQSSDGGDGSSGSGGSGGSGGSTFVEEPQFITETVFDHSEYYPNNQARIDEINRILPTLNAQCAWTSYFNGFGYSDFYQCTGPDASQAEALGNEKTWLTPAQTINIYKTIQVPNPNWHESEMIDPTHEIITLNSTARQIYWSFFSNYLQGIPTGGFPVLIPTKGLIASVDFIYCGCADCEIDCGDCCLSLVEVAATLTQLFS